MFFFFSSRRRHTRSDRDWSSDVCSSDLDRAVRTRRTNPQILDGFGTLAVFGGKPDDDRKMPVAAGFIEIAGAVAADRHLDGGIDISRRQPVSGSLRAIDIDLDGRLAKRGEYRQIGNALHGGKDR